MINSDTYFSNVFFLGCTFFIVGFFLMKIKNHAEARAERAALRS